MQSYSDNTSDYDQSNFNTNRGYVQGLKDSQNRYSRTREANLKRGSRTYAKNRTDEGDEISSVYSQSSNVQPKLGTNVSVDFNGYHRSPLANEQQYETEDENIDNSSSVRSSSGNAHGSSVTLTTQFISDPQKSSVEMSDIKPIPGRPDVYNDFNNNYQHRGSLFGQAAKSNDVLMDPADNYEADYTDRDFPGGGKSARQSIAGENLVIVKERKPRCCCCSRKICVIITFIILVIVAISLYFIWPRIPAVSIDGNQTLSSTTSKPIIRQQPPLVDISINVQVLIDNRENWIPYKFKFIDVQVFDSASLSTYKGLVATGNVTDYVLQPRAISKLAVPIHIFYQPSKGNDPTFQDIVKACVKDSTSTQSFLNFNVNLKLYIAGIDWIYKPEFSIPVSDFKCPYSLIMQ